MEIIQYKQVVSSWSAHIIVYIHESLWKPHVYIDYYHMKQWKCLMSPHRFASIAQGFVIWEQCHYPLSLCCVVSSSIVQYSLLHTLSCTASACLCNTQITPTDLQTPQTHTALTSIRVFLTLTRQTSRVTQAYTLEDHTLEMLNDFCGDTMTLFSFSLFLRGCKK